MDHRDNSLIYNYREGMDNVLPPPDDGQIYRLFRAVKATGKRLGIHAENFSIVRALTQEVLAVGAQDYAALLRTRPVSCETSIIDTAIDMAKELSMPLHVLHVGVGDGVEHASPRQGRRRGCHRRDLYPLPDASPTATPAAAVR